MLYNLGVIYNKFTLRNRILASLASNKEIPNRGSYKLAYNNSTSNNPL